LLRGATRNAHEFRGNKMVAYLLVGPAAVDYMDLTGSRRKVASTGLEVTALGIGSCPLGGLYCDVPTARALEVLSTAWDLGIRYLDTAPFYGNSAWA